MRFFPFLLLAGFTLPLEAQVTLSKDASPPAINVVTSLTADGGTFTTVFDSDSSAGNASGDRGQTFTTAEIPGSVTSWEISEIAIAADNTINLSGFASAEFKLWVFEWSGTNGNDKSNWQNGTGSSSGNPFTGTGISNFLVNGVTTPANLTFTNNDVLHFQFSPALQMQENKAYGFLISLEDGSTTSNGTNSDLRLQLTRDNVVPNGEAYPDGFGLTLNNSNYSSGTQNTDDLRFYIVGTPAPAPGTYIWTAGGDGQSLFEEANWTENGDGSTFITSIDPGVSVNQLLVVNSGNPGGAGATGSLDLGTGSLTSNSGTLRLNLGVDHRIKDGPVSVAGGTVVAEGIENVAATLSAGLLELDAPGNPLLNSTINFTTASTATLALNNESPFEVLSEHLSKITINGQAAENGVNVRISGDGSSGALVTLFSGDGDEDDDDMPDAWELQFFGSFSRDGTLDFDADGLLDLAEYNAVTDPTNTDTDGDLLRDGDETTSDPAVADTDGDSNPDGFEIAKGTNPNNPSSKTARPNILFILCDDLGYGDLGVLFQNAKSGKKHLTPNLDQLAAEGIILNRHYTPAPVCAPCRGSLLQGVHQGHANIRNNQFDRALANNHTLATTLKTAGYRTSLIGKWGIQGSGGSPALWPAYPTKRGFDEFFGYVRHGDGHTHYPFHTTDSRGPVELYDQDTMIRDDLNKCYTADLFTARAKKLIIDETTAHPERPFFLYLAYDTPHAALQLPTQAYPAGGGTSGGLQWNGTSGSMINTASGTIDSFRHPDYTSAVGNAWTDVEERFATSVRRLDDCVGDLRQTLVDLGIANNTLIVFTSDNGPHTEDYLTPAQTNDGSSYTPQSFDSYGPFEGVKRDNWEGGIRMPTIVAWPGTIPAGQVDNTPSQMHDWMPTLVELSGWTPPGRTDGVSLVPLLTGTGTQAPPQVYIEYFQSSGTPNYGDFSNHGGTSRKEMQTIFLDGYKGVRNNITSHATPFQIYDIENDNSEGNNLAGSSPFFNELQQKMKDTVLRIRKVDPASSRPYDSELVPAVTTPVDPGLHYSRYEGLWPWMPEFELLTPVGQGTASNIAATTHLSRPDDAGLLYTGYLNVPTGGTWTFSATSDAGVYLRIHDSQVIDDDFTHTGTEASGTILLEAGLHPFRLYYRSQFDTPALGFSWSGPGTAKQAVPDAALFSAPEPVGVDDTSASINGATILLDVLANDIDDGLPSALSIQSVSAPSNGSATISGTQIEYTPSAGYFGTDSFSYTFTDGQFSSIATATVDTIYQAPDLWIPLNESSGTDIHEAGEWLAGTLNNATEAAHILGVHGKALAFDGIDDEVLLNQLPELPSGNSPRTIMAWIRVQPNTALENQAIFSYGINSSGQRFTFRLNGNPGSAANQPLRLEVQSGSIGSSTNLADGQWHHVCVVIPDGATDVTDALFYVDGTTEATANPSSQTLNTASGTTAILGGASHSTSFNFAGDIDELRIYPEALSLSEIQAVANAGQQIANAWHRARYGASPIDWNADDDADGMSRLLEYALVSDPRVPSTDALPKLGFDGTDLSFAFERWSEGCHELDYAIKTSEDLSQWDPATISGVSLQNGATSTSENVVFDLGTTADPRRFFRLEVSFAP